MGFFHFLGDVAQTVEHKAGTAVHGNSNPGGGVFGFLRQADSIPINAVKYGAGRATDNQAAAANAANAVKAPVKSLVTADKSILHFGVSSGQQIAGSGVQLGASAYNAAAPHVGLPQQNVNPSQFGTPGKVLLGDKPIKPVQSTFTEAKKAGHGNLFSAGLAGLVTAADLPFGGGKKGLVDELVKASTAKDAQKVLVKNGVDATVAQKIAPSVASTKDPNIIKNIIQKAHTPPEPIAPPTGIPPPVQDVAPPNPINEAINKHLGTISNAQSTTPELQDAIKGLKQTHAVRDTQKLSDQAKAAVEKDYTGSLTKALTAENPSDKDVALGAHLMVSAQRDAKAAKEAGDMATASAKQNEAVTVAETLANNSVRGGQFVQAHSIIGRLSPEGMLLYATRQLKRARELNPGNIDKEQQAAREIKDTIENAKPNLGKQDVSNIVKDATEAASKEPRATDNPFIPKTAAPELSTGEKVAKSVEAAATPPKPHVVDQLVQEITKKVKQEHLEPRVTARKAPLDIIKEVMERNSEAQAAYPEAQQILRTKFAGDERMSEALDKFFGSKLGTPVASSTFDRAIGDTLKANQSKITNIIHSSIKNQHQTVDELAADLTKEGFDEQSASTIAKEVHDRLTTKVANAKKSALENLSKDVKNRNVPTVLDKINKFSNLGALDGHDYLQLARAKLNLPHLTDATASKIHELSQNLQDLPEGHEKYAAVRQIQHLIGNEIPKSKGDLLKEIAGLPRTILASGDLSFGGRQGLVYATTHPITFAKAWPQQFTYFKQAFKGSDSEAFDAMMADIRSHPDYHLLEKAKISLTEPTGNSAAKREEQFLSSDLAEKIPALGRLVRGSNYAYTGLGNTLKANQFYGMIDHLHYAGIEPSDKLLQDLGEVINTSLGRGGKAGGFVEKHAGFLSSALFSPRLIASRLNVMNPRYYLRLQGPARQEALKGLLGLSAFAMGVLGLAKLSGADVNIDPRSADFGKIKLGDTRLDVLAGFTQYIRLGAQLGTGHKINSTTGADTELGKGLASSRLDVLTNFLEGKANPTVSAGVTALKGKDVSGNNIYTAKGAASQLAQRFIPLVYQDINDLRTHPNAVKGSLPGKAGAAAAGVVGVGVQTYGTQDEPTTPKQQKYLDNLKKTGADPNQIKADESFFQFLKTSAGTKQNVSSAIDKAIASNNVDKAKQLADAYNKKLSAGVAPWIKQYGSKSGHSYVNQDLLDAYHARQINLTPSSIKSRLKTATSNKP